MNPLAGPGRNASLPFHVVLLSATLSIATTTTGIPPDQHHKNNHPSAETKKTLPCTSPTSPLEIEYWKWGGSISNIDGAEYHCNKTAVRKVISGVVGAASSVTSIQVANLLRLFRIPQLYPVDRSFANKKAQPDDITALRNLRVNKCQAHWTGKFNKDQGQVSFFSTSPELSNKQRFEYFTRTIPSDHYQVKAMVDIVLTMGWSYVSIIYEESNYGIKAFEELEELLGKNDICIAIKEKLVKDSGVAKETAYDNIVLKLLTKPRARGSCDGIVLTLDNRRIPIWRRFEGLSWQGLLGGLSARVWRSVRTPVTNKAASDEHSAAITRISSRSDDPLELNGDSDE
ncbi:Metabotropic glutamate receptor 3 [Eufriesea mexicana]|nr:Metabotropic glutamate receptor 3 [Eufriesea mexicana]